LNWAEERVPTRPPEIIGPANAATVDLPTEAALLGLRAFTTKQTSLVDLKFSLRTSEAGIEAEESPIFGHKIEFG
jgi:hypothetical protein